LQRTIQNKLSLNSTVGFISQRRKFNNSFEMSYLKKSI
jgi:hypothetical protein